jgi:sulfur carrier protein ThiS
MVRVGDRELLWREGMTVADVLQELEDAYPYAVARIDGQVLSRPDFEKAMVSDNAEIFLIPMIVGG